MTLHLIEKRRCSRKVRLVFIVDQHVISEIIRIDMSGQSTVTVSRLGVELA